MTGVGTGHHTDMAASITFVHAAIARAKEGVEARRSKKKSTKKETLGRKKTETNGRRSRKNEHRVEEEPVVEEHKIFDEVVVRVRAGNGGDGELAQPKRGRTVRNFKYHAGKNQKKEIFLPAGEPCAGGDGGDVVIQVDPALYGLTHIHKREVYSAKNGSNGDAGGSFVRRVAKQPKREALVISVPPGTSVHRKKSGQLIAELLQPGQKCTVAVGGTGGAGVVMPSQKKRMAQRSAMEDEMVFDVEDFDWKADAKGMPGEELTLRLLLRVVADVGIVGLPNAGKSSLLRAMTNAKPRIARYPFTTLMPNLGVLELENDDPDDLDPMTPVLADLPGLIEGAHLGKGLGRNFLRHLRRTNVMIHVLDATRYNIYEDFLVIREELRMYNPEYVKRPYVLVLNKMDMPRAESNRENAHAMIEQCLQEMKDSNLEVSFPSAVVETSAKDGTGVEQLMDAVKNMMQALKQ